MKRHEMAFIAIFCFVAAINAATFVGTHNLDKLIIAVLFGILALHAWVDSRMRRLNDDILDMNERLIEELAGEPLDELIERWRRES